MKTRILLSLAAFASCQVLAGSSLPKPDEAEVLAILDGMTTEQKAMCVVGLERALFPPTNSGFAARTVPFDRFDIPSLILADGTAGVRLSRKGAERATAFPANIALASSWDRQLAWEVGEAAGREAKGYNVNVLLAPGMNIIRNPLCGRNFEYYSEDPLLAGKMGASYVSGIQSNGVASSVKHFTCNNQETNRTLNDVRISERALREIYLRCFEICVKEASPWTVMSSYNHVNGVPVQENPYLLTDILKNEWGFSGLVMTDWTSRRHNTLAQLHAGNDLFMPGDKYQVEDIIRGISDGSLSMEDLDRACLNVLTLARRCRSGISTGTPDLSHGAEISMKAACESSVLLENRDMLPLPPKGKAALFGVRSYALVVTGSGAGFVVCPPARQICTSFKAAGVDVDPALEDLYLKYSAFASADIEYNEKIKVHIGLPLLPELEVSRKLIDKCAQRDDYAVITIGRTAEEGKDRLLKDDYYLTDTERRLLENVCEAFHAQGKKVAVVLNISGIIETESWKSLPDAILDIWLPGQEGGEAAYALLSGKVNPSGRLAVSFPKDYHDSPSAMNFPYDSPDSGRNYDYTEYSEGIYVGYRYFCTEGKDVSYPFGHGLSYTSFTYSGLKVKATKKGFTVSYTVTNSGPVPGKDASGIYVSAPSGGIDKPAVELKGFAKTGLLLPGESQLMTTEITADELASFNDQEGRWVAAKGKYTILVGGKVTDLKLSTCVNGKHQSTLR